jgi:hypothetical protein
MSVRNLPGGKGRPEPKADNLTAICEILDVSQPYGPPRLLTGISLFFYVILYYYYVQVTSCGMSFRISFLKVVEWRADKRRYSMHHVSRLFSIYEKGSEQFQAEYNREIIMGSY